MSPRGARIVGRSSVDRAARAGRAARRGAARAEGASRRICGRATRSNCGRGSCWRWCCSSPASSSTSRSRSSTSTRSMRCRRRSPGLIAVPVARDPGLWRRAGPVAGFQRAAQRGFREGRTARGAPPRAVDVPAHPCAVAALSPRTAHRRSGARRRARHGGDRIPAVVHAVQRRADVVRDRRRLRDPVAALRLDLRARHAGDDRRLYRLHLHRDRLAHPPPARDEHAQHRGEHEGGRQPAQLRDRQIFRERGARGGTLRPRAAGL